ncbi:MAG: RDD family protein [Pseudomonadaceae bacterium]|nr:RDD family protein [Pseudomonadaceae bacterium]
MTTSAELPIAEQASLLRRLGALIYDGLLVVAIYAFTIVVIVTVTGEAAVGPFVQSFIFAEIFAFFVYFWTRHGQTLGMRAWHLTLVNLSGSQVSLAQAALRFFVGLAGLLALGMGVLWVMVDPHRRSWSDLMSDSRIRFNAPEPKSK